MRRAAILTLSSLAAAIAAATIAALAGIRGASAPLGAEPARAAGAAGPTAHPRPDAPTAADDRRVASPDPDSSRAGTAGLAVADTGEGSALAARTQPRPDGSPIDWRVVDSAARGVAGATVWTFDGWRHLGVGRRAVDWTLARAVATTDAAGRFAVTAGDASRAVPAAPRIAHRDGAFAFPTGDGATLEFAPVAALEIEVLDAAGRPRAGAEVIAWPSVGDLFPAPPAGLDPGAHPLLAAFRATTGTDGIARFAALPCPPPMLASAIVTADGATAHTAGIALDPRRTTRAALRLADPVPVVLAGAVRDDAGQPIAGAVVIALGATAGQATTGGDGRFALPAVTAPRELLVRADGFAPRRLAVDADGTIAVATEGDRDAAAPPAGTITLARAVELFGETVDDLGRPIADVAVWATDGDHQTRLVHSDAHGRFQFGAVAAGRPVALRAGDGGPRFATADDSPVRLTVVPDTGPGARLIATLRGRDGAPLRGHRARLEPADDRPVRLPAPRPVDGGVRADDLPPGAWRLAVQPTAGAPLVAEFHVAAGQREVRLDVAQPPSATVELTVLGDAAALGPGPPLELTFAGPDRGRFVRAGAAADAGDRITLDALPTALRIVDCAADRPLSIVVAGDGPLGGRARLERATAGHAVLRLTPRAAVRMTLPATAPGAERRVVWAPADGGAPQIVALVGPAEPTSVRLDAATWTWRFADEPAAMARPLELRAGEAVDLELPSRGR